MRTPYARGADFERRVRAKLEARGYLVLRTAGSKSPIDLIAARRGMILAIQCKSGKRGASLAERIALKDAAEEFGAIPWIVGRGMMVTELRIA